MNSTTRRHVLKTFAAGGLLAGSAPATASAQHGQLHVPPLAHAVVAFGQWARSHTGQRRPSRLTA